MSIEAILLLSTLGSAVPDVFSSLTVIPATSFVTDPPQLNIFEKKLLALFTFGKVLSGLFLLSSSSVGGSNAVSKPVMNDSSSSIVWKLDRPSVYIVELSHVLREL